jgi:hypothetical protein
MEIRFFIRWHISLNQELTTMVTKASKPNETKSKRLSKGKRTHVRRLKQEARKSTNIPRA